MQVIHSESESRSPGSPAASHACAGLKTKLLGLLAAGLLAGPMAANALSFNCISGTLNDCTLATSTLSWTWDGLDFTVSNDGSGYVSEFYFDLSSGMSASFLGGTGGNVLFYSGASPGSLPGGASVSFVSDASFDSDPAGVIHNGLDLGETATFRIAGASLDSFTNDTLAAGLHARSLIDSGASLVTADTNAVPEPGTLALLGLGLVGLGTARRRKTAVGAADEPAIRNALTS